jgi:hypothetical protein
MCKVDEMGETCNMEEMRNEYKILLGIPGPPKRRSLGGFGSRLENIIEICIK